jgi:hypothetical protein
MATAFKGFSQVLKKTIEVVQTMCSQHHAQQEDVATMKLQRSGWMNRSIEILLCVTDLNREKQV